MKRKIRRAFENITPNVLNNVLSQIPGQKQNTKQKKIIEWKKYLATAAAVLLLFSVGYAGAAILTGGESGIGVSKPQQPTTDQTITAIFTEKTATDIALADLYANEKKDILNVTDTRAKLTETSEGAYYDVVLRFDSTTYIYEIDASTGLIKKMSVDEVRDSNLQLQNIPWQTARDAALKHAEVAIEVLTGLEIELENNGIYSIDFCDQRFEYEYEIDAYSGKVLQKSLETDDDRDPIMSMFRSRQYSVKTALAYANVSYEDLYYLESSSDYKSDPPTRTIKFIANDKTYEFTLFMDSHGILSSNTDTPAVKHITTKDALSAVVGSSENIDFYQISDLSIELTEFEGIPAYEIEITANGFEWEAFVDATTGDVRKLEKESDDQDSTTFGFTNLALDTNKISKLDLTYLNTDYNKDKNCYDVTFTLNGETTTINVFEKTKDPETPTIAPTNPVATEKPTEIPTETPTEKPTEAPTQPSTKPDNTTVPEKNIGAEDAIAAAIEDLADLKHEIDRKQVMYEYAKLDEDDGETYYDVKFYSNGILYECEVNAASGEVSDWDKDELEQDDKMILTKELDLEIRNAFFETYVSESEKTYHSVNDLTVEYYGEYDDAHVVMVNGILGYDDGNTTKVVATLMFEYPTSQELLVYDEGKFMTLEEAFEHDVLEYGDIVFLHMYYTAK